MYKRQVPLCAFDEIQKSLEQEIKKGRVRKIYAISLGYIFYCEPGVYVPDSGEYDYADIFYLSLIHILNQFLALGRFRGVLILIALMATIAVGGSRMIWRVCSKDRISGSLDDATRRGRKCSFFVSRR